MASIDKYKFTEYIKRFDFTNLFNELGWDHEKRENSCIIDGLEFSYKLVAFLKGYYIITLGFKESEIPKEPIRRKISVKISQTYPESLIIFHGEKTQYWGYRVQMETGKEKYSETNFSTTQESDALYQRAAGLFFDIDEMDKVAFVDVKAKVRKSFSVNYDTVTKKFYDVFKKEHSSFKESIEGIINDSDLDWYASVTLNRLMFCYFIQKKGFLNNDPNYLKNKLAYFISLEDEKGFYTFYQEFLMILFHGGLGAIERDETKQNLLGNIPYLNGGMFEVHELEQRYGSIDIPNSAFERIFDFFDQYKWHLDINPDAPGNEINPDVLGYIFEKYINQRAEMGAYYTKEDITGYIGKNTIIPFLFEEVKRHYPKPFEVEGEIWSLMQNSGDEYIYPAIKYGLPNKAKETLGDEGLFDDLPQDVQTGLDPEQKDLWIKRKPWNKSAPKEIALPTEIYREVIERRNRYGELTAKIKTGEIKEINDLITYNLDIIGFVYDLLAETQDTKLLEYFYNALIKVTILDPTCGSGAFLFAAMNILEPLYEIIIERMRALVRDEERTNVENYNKGKLVYSDKFRFFKETLGNISGLKNPNDPESGNKHPNQKYFIFKSIILNNLYGVDIMKEAVEIAKLRLFLKLVAQVHPDQNSENLGIEPLPDMDFNIKCGNTLVGFATKKDIENISSLLLDENLKDQIYEECEKISMVFEHFKKEQLSGGETSLLKLELINRITQLNENLNLLLYKAYYGGGVYGNWKSSHQPFHWFAEFYEILEKNGGFDVIIGNPPYVEYSEKRFIYSLKAEFRTIKCGNLYAFILERTQAFLSKGSNYGYIIPISAFCTKRMKPLVEFVLDEASNKWFSHFGWRPATLFDGVNIPVTILITHMHSSPEKKIHSTDFLKWYSEQRRTLFEMISYANVEQSLYLPGIIPKLNNYMIPIITKVYSKNKRIKDYCSSINTKYKIYYRNTGGLYWRIITNFPPYFKQNGAKSFSCTSEEINVKNVAERDICTSLLNSNLFWLHYEAFSPFHHVNDRDILEFPFDINDCNFISHQSLQKLCSKLMEEMKKNSVIMTRNHKGGSRSEIQTFYPSKTKYLVDEIDTILCDIYSFSQSELDFIIYYDFKFRAYDELD